MNNKNNNEKDVHINTILENLPMSPGCYLMKDQSGEIIYIGKAKLLRNRVRSYFQSSKNHNHKTKLMVASIRDIEIIVTDSELEALVLESTLIKQHQPKYNILLKDDKHFPFIKLTLEREYPTVEFTRKIIKDGSKYFGPYPSALMVNEIIDLIKGIFRIQNCKRKFPEEIGKQRPCLYHHMGRCDAICSGKISPQEYQETFKKICSFLNGKTDIISEIRRKMYVASDNLEFEQATVLRTTLEALEALGEKQKIISSKRDNADFFALRQQDQYATVLLFYIRGGKLSGRDHYNIINSTHTESECLLSEFIKQYYETSIFIPEEIFVPFQLPEQEGLTEYLRFKRNAALKIHCPQRGEQKKIMEMTEKNAALALDSFVLEQLSKEVKSKPLTELQQLLSLPSPPIHIEAYDISNISGTNNVASGICLKNGQFYKNNYRRYKINTVQGSDDYASMREVLARRFTHSDVPVPDLLLLDGGVGHVNMAVELLSVLSISVPVYGMVKDDKHRTRGLIGVEGQVSLTGSVFHFIAKIQDEVHRFAIEYHKILRKKEMFNSQLDQIPGVGKKRKEQLLQHFKTHKQLKEASVEQLCCVKGIDQTTAQSIYQFFRPVQ